MSFITLSRELFETTTFKLKPQVHFVSSSEGEVPATGSAYVAPIRSKCIRDVYPGQDTINFSESVDPFSEENFILINSLNSAIEKTIRFASEYTGSGINIHREMDTYMSRSNESGKNIRFSKFLDMFRFDPSFRFDLNHVVKRNINHILYPYHQHRYPNSGQHYTNYNCLNFFTGSNFPPDSCLIYPNKDDIYTPEKGFCLDFWINPKYDNVTPESDYLAGTVFHQSSSIAVSLVSGSNLDEKNLVGDFKILLQLSHSADLNPSSINLNSINAQSDLVFTSSFNLKKNNWHHVSINWDPSIDNSSGSIRIDDTLDRFYIPSASLCTKLNNAIFVGNFYDGENSEIQKFFNATAAQNQGLTQLTALTAEPAAQKNKLSNGLNAEVHDIKLFKRALHVDEIENIKTKGINQIILTKLGCEISEDSLYNDLVFYVPPYFYPDTRERQIFITPFQTTSAKTTKPFNTLYSFGVGGKIINLENFTREFVQGEYPRLQSLTGSTIDTTVQNITANDHVYNTGSLCKRNLTILPCDNGKFFPDYYAVSISHQSASDSYYVDAGGNVDYSRVSLDNLVPSSSILRGLVREKGSIFFELAGVSPKRQNASPGSILTIAQRLRDRSSNESVVFDMSNLYYGNQITPQSFEVVDHDLTGSQGLISIKVKDDGQGSLYRADCLTEHAKWNNIGDLFYYEGMAVIKTPHLPFFCKDKTDIKLKGDQNIHTMILNIPCDKDLFNSSSNKTYIDVPPTKHYSDSELSTVYITSVNIHDDNFNIIMRANFSQPIPKTEEDEFVIRLKQDF